MFNEPGIPSVSFEIHPPLNDILIFKMADVVHIHIDVRIMSAGPHQDNAILLNILSAQCKLDNLAYFKHSAASFNLEVVNKIMMTPYRVFAIDGSTVLLIS